MSRKYPGDNKAKEIFATGYHNTNQSKGWQVTLPSPKFLWIYHIGVSEAVWEDDTRMYLGRNTVEDILERIKIIRAL